jgi:WD40 repeat protein
MQQTNGGDPSGMEVGLELEHSIGFSNNSQGISFHPMPNKSLVAYGCGRILIVNDLDDPHEQKLLSGHDAPISALDVSATGSLMVSGQSQSIDSFVYVNIWDFHSCSIKMRIQTGHKGKVEVAKFSPDEAMLATTGSEGSLIIWDVASGKAVGTFKDSLSTDEAKALCWGPMYNVGTRDQKYSLFCAFNTGVRLCTLSFSIKKLAFELTAQPCQVPGSGGRMGGFVRKYQCCSLIGEDLLCGTSSGDVVIYNVVGGLYRTSLTLAAAGVNAIADCSLHQCAFVGGGDGKLRKIAGKEKDWQLYGEIQLEGAIVSMAMSQDQHQLVILTTAGLMYRMLTANMSFTVAAEAPLGGLRDTCLSPERPDLFATVSNDGLLRVWDLNTYSVMSYFSLAHGARAGHATDVAFPTACAFDPEPLHVVCGWSDGRIRCVRASSSKGEVAWTLANGHRGSVHTVKVCPLYIVSGGEDSVIRIWSRGTKDLVAQLQNHKLPTTGVCIDNTTCSIVHTFSLDMTLLAFDLSKQDTNRNVKGPKQVAMHSYSGCGGFTCATQRPNHEHEMIIGTADGTVLVYDLDYPQPVLVITDAARMRVTACECSPDGNHLVVGLADGSLVVYRLREDEKDKTQFTLVLQAVCHSGAVVRCCWTADGKQILSSGADGELIVWNFYTARR